MKKISMKQAFIVLVIWWLTLYCISCLTSCTTPIRILDPSNGEVIPVSSKYVIIKFPTIDGNDYRYDYFLINECDSVGTKARIVFEP